MKKTLKYLLFAFLGLIAIMLINTLRYDSKQEVVNISKIPNLPDSALRHFQQALRYKTISFGHDTKPDSVEFTGFRHFLERTYPLVHKNLKRELVNYSMVFEWRGKNTALKPVIMMAHQDVVPIEPATKDLWEVEPFGGVVKDGYIWGRGTTDDKISLIPIFESAEKLLATGFQPERTIYFIFGHDEEVGGKNGAVPIAKLMEQRGIKAEFILDEGGIVSKGKIGGISKPLALIATAEKGYLSVELNVQINGGHSSAPSEETALDVLAKALVAIRKNQMPQRVTESMQDFFDNVGPEMPFLQRIIFANQWLTKPLIMRIYTKADPKTAAMLRTTTVPTIMQSGIKDNVIPTIAKATVNFRILPGDTSEDVLAHIKNVIGDKRVEIKQIGTLSEPSKVTNVKSFGYRYIAKIAKQNFDGAVTTPFLLIGATDSRHFTKISENIVKFNPMIDPIGFHAVNERVSVESYQRALSFYESLLRTLN